MKSLALNFVMLSFILGCGDSSTSTPPRHVGVSVSYKNGFRGDSLILRCDGTEFGRSLAFSDSIYVPSGYLFTVNEGTHTLSIEDLQLMIQVDTTFQAVSAYRTIIETSLDRRRKVFTSSISYLDTNQISLPHPPARSLQSIMPR